jgi:hypothetical protein
MNMTFNNNFYFSSLASFAAIAAVLFSTGS